VQLGLQQPIMVALAAPPPLDQAEGRRHRLVRVDVV
jgi:hypothetical protein